MQTAISPGAAGRPSAGGGGGSTTSIRPTGTRSRASREISTAPGARGGTGTTPQYTPSRMPAADGRCETPSTTINGFSAHRPQQNRAVPRPAGSVAGSGLSRVATTGREPILRR